jgi:hypothetical protein
MPALWRGFLLFVLFVAFPLLVFWIQGPQPSLIADHIVYFRAADQIRETAPLINPEDPANYWRHYTDNQLLSVLLAYAIPYTHSHILSCRLYLIGITFIYLWVAWVFFSLITPICWQRALLAILSAVYVSYGPMYWGFTDFSASLSRSLVVPICLLALWLLLRFPSNYLRLAIFPILLYATLLHLSALHFCLVAWLFEMFSLPLLPRAKRGARFLALLGALVLTGATLVHLSTIRQSSFGSHIRRLKVFDHAIEPTRPSSDRFHFHQPVLTPAVEVLGTEQVLSVRPKAVFASMPTDEKPQYLTAQGAWEVELTTMRWRNFPPSLATCAQILGSLGVILPLAIIGFAAARRIGFTTLDRQMLRFAVAVTCVALLPQACLWLLRHWFEIYPINTEEFRALALLSIPLLYFTARLSLLLYNRQLAVRRPILAASAVLILYCLQPIQVVPVLPRSWRVQLYDFAVRQRIIDSWDSPRTIYARQVLAINGDADRFYYAIQDVVDWLARQDRGSRVLGNRPELILSGLPVIGSSTGFVLSDNRLQKSMQWKNEMLDISDAISRRDIKRLTTLARQSGARFIVVPWLEPGAAFQGRHYSVLRLVSIAAPII